MSHLLLQASGGYNVGELQAESWTCTTRLALVLGGAVDPVAGLPSWSANTADEDQPATGRVTTSNWNVGSSGNTFSPTDYLVNEAEVAWKSIFAALGTEISAMCVLRSLKLYPIGSNGKTQDAGAPGVKAVASSEFEDSYTGLTGNTSKANPLTVSSVLSWQTPVSGGKGRGRMYLPAVSTSVANGVWPTAAQTKFLAAGVGFIQKLTTNAAGISVAPIVTGHPWTHYGRITSVKSGRVPDTQRRRDAQIQEMHMVGKV